MKRIRFIVACAVAFCGYVATPAHASYDPVGCKQGVCLGQDSAQINRNVFQLHMKANGATHFNVRDSCRGGGQVEVNASGYYTANLKPSSPARCSLSIQFCRRGGNVGPFSGRSSCGRWAEWSLVGYNGVVGGHKVCRGGFCGTIENHTGDRFITIKLTSWPRSTHRNIRSSNGQQIEGNTATLPGGTISVQACNKGTFGRSSCSAWVNFH